MAKKTAAQLNREIREALASPRTSHASRQSRSHATMKGARKLGRIGDVNPIDYGGGYIFSAPDVGGPWVEYFEGLDDDERVSRISYDEDADEKIDALKVNLYHVDLGKNGPDFLSDYDWVRWKDVAASTGQDPLEYAPGKLRTAKQRAQAVQDAAGYHGWHEFDQQPLQLTVAELRERWGK